MPGGDKTGPMGEGAMTGRRAGFCAGTERPGFVDVARGRGRGQGRGQGRGRGFGSRDGSGRRGRRNETYSSIVPGWVRSRRDKDEELSGERDQESQRSSENEFGVLKSLARFINERLGELETRLRSSRDTVSGEDRSAADKP